MSGIQPFPPVSFQYAHLGTLGNMSVDFVQTFLCPVLILGVCEYCWQWCIENSLFINPLLNVCLLAKYRAPCNILKKKNLSSHFLLYISLNQGFFKSMGPSRTKKILLELFIICANKWCFLFSLGWKEDTFISLFIHLLWGFLKWCLGDCGLTRLMVQCRGKGLTVFGINQATLAKLEVSRAALVMLKWLHDTCYLYIGGRQAGGLW